VKTSRRFANESRADGIVWVDSISGQKPESVLNGRFIGDSRGDGFIGAESAGSRQRGYTLIEVLVAFAVLALALTLLLGTLSGATRQVRWSADAGRAALHAQSLLAQTGVGEALQPGRSDGVFEEGRYRWLLEVAPYADPLRPAPATVEPFTSQLMQLRLQVEWGDGVRAQRLQLDTLRLVQPDPTQGGLQ
jgi:general secretion pathway protein I